SSTSASTYSRGKPWAASSPRRSALLFDGTGVSMTRTPAKPWATCAVASVHPFATTTTFSSPGSACSSSLVSSRPTTRCSLWAGTTTLITCGVSARRAAGTSPRRRRQPGHELRGRRRVGDVQPPTARGIRQGDRGCPGTFGVDVVVERRGQDLLEYRAGGYRRQRGRLRSAAGDHHVR